jgi:hypothetical protein
MTAIQRLNRSGGHERQYSNFILAFLCAMVLSWGVSSFASGPYVSGFKAGFENQKVVVSFGVGEAFNRDDLREAIDSTRTVTITFTAEVIKHRLLWKNKTIAKKVIKRLITFDNLTRQYTIQTLVDGEQSGEDVAASYDEMAEKAASVRDIEVTSVADIEPGAAYTVRARVRLLSGFTLWIIPWDVETPWVSQELDTP